LEPRWISEVDADGVRSVQAGAYKLAIGGAQPMDAKSPSVARTVSFSIQGNQVLPR
jgi:beta-glucosidase